MTDYTGAPATLVAGDTSALVTKFNDHRDALKAMTEAADTYTPTLTNITIGNGTTTAAYARATKWIDFRVRILFGSTTTIGGSVTISLPVTGISTPQIVNCFIGSSGGTVPFKGEGFLPASATVVQPFHPTSTTNGTQIQLGSAALTMGTNAYIMIQGRYEAA